MIHNCAKVINESSECCGYLVADAVVPTGIDWKYLTLDKYNELIKNKKVHYVLWDDIVTTSFCYMKNEPELSNCFCGTYLTVSEELVQKVFSRDYNIIMIPQVIWRYRYKNAVMLTFIGNSVDELAIYINRYHPNVLDYSGYISGSVFRMLCRVDDLFDSVLPKSPNIILPCTLDLFNFDRLVKSKNNYNRKFTLAKEEAYDELRIKFEEYGESYALPDLEPYGNIRAYQRLMSFSNEDMAVKLYQLMKLYKTPTLEELDDILQSVV